MQLPNILYVFADQLSALALNMHGGLNKVYTPHMDELARNGVRFGRHYCSTPQCSPSRSTILTGLYPHKTGVIGNIGTRGTSDLNPDLKNMGSYLKQQGYRTGYFGKWHLGTPIHEFGFDSYSEYDPGNDHHSTADAVTFLTMQNEKPWFTMVSYNNPHDIYLIEDEIKSGMQRNDSYELPSNFADDLASKPHVQAMFRDDDQGKPLRSFGEQEWKQYLAFYYGLVERVDQELGRLIDSLKENGQLENTIIIFSSDHGDLMAAHRCPFKGPMMYEELVNIPLIVSYPKMLPVGVTREQLSVNTDVFPTICDLLGLQIPLGLDGISLKNCMLGSQENSRDYIVLQYYSKQDWVNPIRTIVNKEYKYNLYLDGQEELYKIGPQQDESCNLVDDRQFSHIKQQMKELLFNWILEEDDPFFSYYTTDRTGKKKIQQI